MPLNLNLHAPITHQPVTNIYTKSLYQNSTIKSLPINGMKNGLIKTDSIEFSKLDKDKKSSGIATITQISSSPITTMSAIKAENIEPPTKMIKLFNGSVAPMPVDNKDNNKYMQLALSQVSRFYFPL